MSVAVRSDGKINKALESFIDEMDTKTREEVDEIVESLRQRPVKGGQYKFDQCTMKTLLKFNDKYFEMFGEPCRPGCYYLMIKFQQSAPIRDYQAPKSDESIENIDNNDMIKILKS